VRALARESLPLLGFFVLFWSSLNAATLVEFFNPDQYDFLYDWGLGVFVENPWALLALQAWNLLLLAHFWDLVMLLSWRRRQNCCNQEEKIEQNSTKLLKNVDQIQIYHLEMVYSEIPGTRAKSSNRILLESHL